MKYAWLVAMGTAILGGCSPSPPDGTDDASTLPPQREVQNLLDRYSEAVGEGRWEQVISLYVDDPRFIWAEDGRIAYQSIDQIREAFEGLQGQFTAAETEFSNPRVIALGPGVAHVTATVQQHFTTPEGDDFGFTALMTAAVVQTEMGWRFLAGHTSSERDRIR